MLSNNAWQLAVVDYDLLRKFYTKGKTFGEIVERAKNKESSLKDGEVVYIITIIDLCPTIGEITELPKSRVWIPGRKRYGYALLDMLRPILVEKDIVEVEMKFGIDLNEYVN